MTPKTRSTASPTSSTVCFFLLLLSTAFTNPIGAQAADTDGNNGEPPHADSAQEIQGVDVSHHSGNIEWDRVAAAGYAFAYVKATEGIDALDPTFAANWQAIGETSIRRGAYHFYVTEDDPDTQADFFIRTVGDLAPEDLIPVVDIEILGHGTQPGLASRLRTFLDRIEERYGVKPMIYTGPNFWNAHLDDSFGAYPLWIAQYDTDSPRLPEGWTTWTIWQWAQDRSVPGIEKDVDPDRLSAAITLDALRIDHRQSAGKESATEEPR